MGDSVLKLYENVRKMTFTPPDNVWVFFYNTISNMFIFRYINIIAEYCLFKNLCIALFIGVFDNSLYVFNLFFECVEPAKI